MRKKPLIVFIVVLAAVFLSGCTGSIAWPGLAASDEVAYLANNTAVHAINLKTGTELWSFSGEKSSGFSLGRSPKLFVTSPVITQDGSVIIVSSGNDYAMYAVNPKDIDPDSKAPIIEWKFTGAKGHWVAAPLVVGNRLFAPNADGNIYVLDLNDGQSVKQAIKVIPSSTTPGEKPDRLWATPVSDGQRLFFTSLDKSVFAIDLQTYKSLWHKDIGGAVPGGLAIGSDGMLYVGSLAKQIERFDPATGDHESVLDTRGWIWGTPVADGDNLYFSDVEGYFYSYNTKEGKLNWEPVKPDGAITASPLVLGDRVLVATESGGIYSIGADGSVDLWYQEAGKGKAYTTPVFAGGVVLVAYLESDHFLIALDEQGHQAWVYPPPK